MKELFLRYVFTLMHPFEVHRHLRLERAGGGGILPFDGEEASRYRGVEYYEAMAVSWLFFLCHSFYSPVALHLGMSSRQFLQEQGGIFPLQEWGQGILLIKLVAAVTFFPLVTWIWGQFLEHDDQVFCGPV